MTDPRFAATARVVQGLGPCLRSVQLLANLSLPQLAEGFEREGDPVAAGILRDALEALQARQSEEPEQVRRAARASRDAYGSAALQ